MSIVRISHKATTERVADLTIASIDREREAREKELFTLLYDRFGELGLGSNPLVCKEDGGMACQAMLVGSFYIGMHSLSTPVTGHFGASQGVTRSIRDHMDRLEKLTTPAWRLATAPNVQHKCTIKDIMRPIVLGLAASIQGLDLGELFPGER